MKSEEKLTNSIRKQLRGLNVKSELGNSLNDFKLISELG